MQPTLSGMDNPFGRGTRAMKRTKLKELVLTLTLNPITIVKAQQTSNLRTMLAVMGLKLTTSRFVIDQIRVSITHRNKENELTLALSFMPKVYINKANPRTMTLLRYFLGAQIDLASWD